MRQQSEPFTDDERAKWPYGQPPALPVGIHMGVQIIDHGNGLCSQLDFVQNRW